jgi:16S rRNA (cytosine1402-N4)-methyltransferase
MHKPVLYNEIIQALQPMPGGRYVDGTLGAGGHAWGILQACAPDGMLLGLEIDPDAIRLAAAHLAEFGRRAILVRASYASLGQQLATRNWLKVNGILLDLGVSSMQLDNAERGFSFLKDGPLDMRFNPDTGPSAADLVNHLSEKELADLFFRYGEERRSHQVARAIVAARPILTTRRLAEVISLATSAGRPGMHPATRVFQALRIAVNRELEMIEAALPQAVTALATGGRLAVISFHSLEDRLVKQFFQKESRDCLCPPRQPVCTCGHHASLRILVRQPVIAGADEIRANPRARSARLRIAERLA